MKNYDSHIHIGDYIKNKEIIENSEYRFQYRLYGAIKPEVIETQKEYVSTLDDFFALPLFFKETNIRECNEYLKQFCEENHKGIPVYLLDDNKNFTGNHDIAIFKEHFLMNDYLKWEERSLSYEFLNDNEGYLLIHCADPIRKEYINELIRNFPKMNIIIAHLGRDTYEKPEFIADIINTFKNKENVYFDLSTIHNFNNIIEAIKFVGDRRILYGSDFPFEYNGYEEVISQKEKLLEALSYNENIFQNNFKSIKNHVYIKNRKTN